MLYTLGWILLTACGDGTNGSEAAGGAHAGPGRYGRGSGGYSSYTTNYGSTTTTTRGGTGSSGYTRYDTGQGEVRDSDGDGLPDDAEAAHGTDPNDPDSDDDGAADGREVDFGSDPLDPDTDDDKLLDGQELAQGTDPLDPLDPGPTPEETGDTSGPSPETGEADSDEPEPEPEPDTGAPGGKQEGGCNQAGQSAVGGWSVALAIALRRGRRTQTKSMGC